jgi:hypothetical protein
MVWWPAASTVKISQKSLLGAAAGLGYYKRIPIIIRKYIENIMLGCILARSMR